MEWYLTKIVQDLISCDKNKMHCMQRATMETCNLSWKQDTVAVKLNNDTFYGEDNAAILA
jgi:hypothetical protein